MATERAIADAGLTEDMVSNLRTGLVMGSGESPVKCLRKPLMSCALEVLSVLDPTGSRKLWPAPTLLCSNALQN